MVLAMHSSRLFPCICNEQLGVHLPGENSCASVAILCLPADHTPPALVVLLHGCRYYSMKQQLLESFGFAAPDRFPVFADRFPIQLLSYLRLSRIQDPLMFAKVRHQQVAARVRRLSN